MHQGPRWLQPSGPAPGSRAHSRSFVSPGSRVLLCPRCSPLGRPGAVSAPRSPPRVRSGFPSGLPVSPWCICKFGEVQRGPGRCRLLEQSRNPGHAARLTGSQPWRRRGRLSTQPGSVSGGRGGGPSTAASICPRCLCAPGCARGRFPAARGLSSEPGEGRPGPHPPVVSLVLPPPERRLAGRGAPERRRPLRAPARHPPVGVKAASLPLLPDGAGRLLSVPCPAASPPRSQVEDALQVSDDGLCSSAACGAFWKPPPGVSPFLPLPVPCLSCSPGSFLNFRFQTLHPTAQCHPARVPRAVLLLSVPFCRTGSFPRGGQGTVPPPPPRSSCRQSRGSRLPLRCGVPALGGEPSGCRVGTSRSVPPLPRGCSEDTCPCVPVGPLRPTVSRSASAAVPPSPTRRLWDLLADPSSFPWAPAPATEATGLCRTRPSGPSAVTSVTTRPPASSPHTLLLRPLWVPSWGRLLLKRPSCHTPRFQEGQGGPLCGSLKIQQKEGNSLLMFDTQGPGSQTCWWPCSPNLLRLFVVTDFVP